jgi:hypothetical protein
MLLQFVSCVPILVEIGQYEDICARVSARRSDWTVISSVYCLPGLSSLLPITW